MSNLKDQYKEEQLPSYNKWPHVKGKKFISLCLHSKYEVTPQQACQYMEAMVHGEINRINQNVTMEDIAKTDDGSILKRRQRCILIEGAPGVGKSTLAWKLCRKWGKGKILQQYQAVLLLRLWEKRVRRVMTEKDVFELYKPVATKELCESCGEGVFLVLDGWDELPVELRERDSFFLDLLQGQVLPDAAVLVTSRPHASEIIVTKCWDHVFQRIEIAGFTVENVQAFVSSNVSDSELLQDFNTYLDSYPDIKSMMYNPLNAAIVVKSYKDVHAKGTYIPTMAEMYSSLIHSLILHYLREHSEYGKRKSEREFCKLSDLPTDVHKKVCVVSKLAYKGITNQQQVIFDNLPDYFDSLGLMQCAPVLYVDREAVMMYNFPHLTIQEYFAAYHMSQQSTEEQVRMFKHHQNNPKMNVVLKLFVGLTDFSNFSDDALLSLLTETRCPKSSVTLSVDGIHILFESKQTKVLNHQSYVHCQLSSGSNLFDYYVLGFVMSHSLCKWVADFQGGMGTKSLMMFAKGASSDISYSVEYQYPIQLQISNKSPYLSSDSLVCINLQQLVSAGTHFLKRVKELRLEGVSLDQSSYQFFLSPYLQLHSLELIKIMWPITNLEMLQQLLYKQKPLRNLTVSLLNTNREYVFETLSEWLSSPGCSLKKLNIGGNQLPLKTTERIIKGLRDNCTLVELDLTQSTINLEALSTLLQLPLVTLTLNDCKLDCRATCVIAEVLCSNTKLVALVLSYNPIGNEGVLALAEMFVLKKNKTLKKLDLSYCCNISQHAVQILKCSIKNNDREIELNLEHLNQLSSSFKDIDAFKLQHALQS